MKAPRSKQAFTLIELLVVISIIAILAGIALPVFSTVQEKGQQTKALSNVKQIALACRIFATDNNGAYPSYTIAANKPTSTPVTDSNTAFAQLFPDYLTNEQIFWEPKAGYGATPPDNRYDNPAPATSSYQYTLVANECSFAYVLGLSDSSNSAFPLIADAFASQSSHTYTASENTKGGVWKGKKAIVAFVDASAQVMKVDQSSMTILGSPLGADLFNTSEANWLSSTQTAVNPK